MKNILLTTLFTGLIFTGNASMAMSSTQGENETKAAQNATMTLPETAKELESKTEKKTDQMIQEMTDKAAEKNQPQAQNTDVIDEMVQSKLKTQMMVLASNEKVENCWAWDGCIDRPRKDEAGYDSYAFN